MGPWWGEHWAEKIAAEVAARLFIPHADVELATRGGFVGAISRDFTEDRARGILLLGNEILFRFDATYEKSEPKPPDHTVERVLGLFGRIGLPPRSPLAEALRSTADVLVGYLLLDALVGNTDRHHENWGLLVYGRAAHQSPLVKLAPSFDHASSLGREISDEERSIRLSGTQQNRTVERYCARGRSPFYSKETGSKQLRVREAFVLARKLRPEAAQFWLSQLESVSAQILGSAVLSVPDSIMTAEMKQFACRVLELNRTFLLEQK